LVVENTQLYLAVAGFRTTNTVVSVPFEERVGIGEKATVCRTAPWLKSIPGYLLLNPLEEYVGGVPDVIVVSKPLPDLSFHPVTVNPSEVVTVILSYASNHNLRLGIDDGSTSPDTFAIANVIVDVPLASYHMIGPDDRGPV
jgi:hypothetical protein